MGPWEMNIYRIVPYVPGDQPTDDKLIKLNTNENPYPSASGMEWALREMSTDRLRKYSDPSSVELITILAEYYEVGEDQMFVGVGSDDVIAVSFLTFFNPQRSVSFPDITYPFCKVWVDLYRIPYETPALDGNMIIRSLNYKGEDGGIIFPNPNTPVGLYMLLDQMEEIVKTDQDVIIIVDEAYIDFIGPSAKELLPGYDNLLVVQIFSKSYPVAGVRIGFALRSPALIKAPNNVERSYNSHIVNLLSQIADTQAVKDKTYFEETRARITTIRERSKKRFAGLGFTFLDSMMNSILVTHGYVPARVVFDALKKEQIYVRYFNAPRLDNSPRVSIGTDEEMDVLFRFLEEHLKEWKPAEDSE